MVLLSAGSAFVGNTAIWLFTAPKLLSAIHLLAIPVALIAGALMVGFTREMFKTDANEDGFFALGGLPSVFVFLLTLLAVGGGLWFGGVDGVNTRNYRLSEIYMRSRASEIAAQQKNPAVPHPTKLTLKLQAIFYNQTKSSAIVNGKTVFVGESVAGWSVAGIEPKSLTLQNSSGETNILLLK